MNQGNNPEVLDLNQSPASNQNFDFLAADNNVNQQPIDYNQESENDFVYEDEKKDNKKFIIIVLLLLLLFAFGGFFGFRWYQNKVYQDWLERIRAGAKAHVDSNQEIKNMILDNQIDKIFIKDILASGNLNKMDLINPKTKKEISICNLVKVSAASGVILYKEVTVNNNTCPDSNKPTIFLNGSDTIQIKQGDSFQDPGASAYDGDGTDITNRLVVVNNVDPTTVGEYTITYNVKNKDGVAADEKIRTVVVTSKTSGGGTPRPPSGGGTTNKDKVKPAVSINGLSSTITSGDKDAYTISFSDNVKLKKITYCTTTCKTENISLKSITKNFTFAYTKTGTYVIKATAYDTSGNVQSVSKTVTVIKGVDNIKPTIKLLSAPSNPKVGETFVVTARFEDNVGVKEYNICLAGTCRTAILSNPPAYIEVPLSVTVNIPGMYNITAAAKDASGNYTGNLKIGSVNVISETNGVVTRPVVTLVSKPATVTAGQGFNVAVKFDGKTPNKIKEYQICYRLSTGSAICNKTTLTTYETIVNKTYNYNFTTPGTYIFTASALNTSPSDNGSGNISLGNVEVVATSGSVVTRPVVTLVSKPATVTAGQGFNVAVKFDGKTPNKIKEYQICYRLSTGSAICNKTTLTTYETIVNKTYNYNFTTPGTYTFTASALNTSPSDNGSGNISLGNVVVN